MRWIAFLIALATFILALVCAATNKLDLIVSGLFILVSIAIMVDTWYVTTWRSAPS